jgi:hypothetical protein
MQTKQSKQIFLVFFSFFIFLCFFIIGDSEDKRRYKLPQSGGSLLWRWVIPSPRLVCPLLCNLLLLHLLDGVNPLALTTAMHV